ncbi:MAG: hypothetical protein H7A45_01730 [Verrucomicrobiales bacterium]|nr:hypothetical protein [Verrucomicrobiales bacterium]
MLKASRRWVGEALIGNSNRKENCTHAKSIPRLLAGVASTVCLSSALAVTFGDGGAALQGVLDGITLAPNANNSSVNVVTDQMSDQLDSYWQIGGSGGSVSTIVIELAGFADDNVFGIFDAADPNNKVPVLAGSAGAGDKALLSIHADGSVELNFVDTGIDFAAGNNFGFYLDATVNALSRIDSTGGSRRRVVGAEIQGLTRARRFRSAVTFR